MSLTIGLSTRRAAFQDPPGVRDARLRSRHWWLTAACCVLLAYALMGKGAGYIGVPPIFIGEFLLAGGAFALFVSGRFRGVRLPGMLWWLAAFCAWGFCRTAPFISACGVDALRDAVTWGYAAFAFIWFFYLVSDSARFPALLRNYQRFATIALLGMPALWVARFLMAGATPRWPWADVTIIEPKPGDIMVHLAGILAFWVSRPRAVVGTWRTWVFGLCAGVLGAYERAAMFALAAVFGLCVILRPRHRALGGLVTMGVLGLVLLATSGIKLEVPVADSAKVREISSDQFFANVLSAVSPSKMGDLDDTKEWRLAWWGEITQYTFGGKYFWSGKGFGVNLADDDGFQVMEDHSLRSPHSAHLMILARAGVPGLALWTIVQAGWAIAVGSALLRSLRACDFQWTGVFFFLLAYWLAFLINASFDVFLEGPMGGIWFWSLYGIGLAALRLWKQQPELLRIHENPYRS